MPDQEKKGTHLPGGGGFAEVTPTRAGQLRVPGHTLCVHEATCSCSCGVYPVCPLSRPSDHRAWHRAHKEAVLRVEQRGADMAEPDIPPADALTVGAEDILEEHKDRLIGMLTDSLSDAHVLIEAQAARIRELEAQLMVLLMVDAGLVESTQITEDEK
jgi:hypothetical protein